MSVQTVDDSTDTIRQWVHEHNGTCLWREQIGNGRVNCYQVASEEGSPKVFLVQRYQGDTGFEVYTPATKSLRIDDTLDALDEWLES